MLTLTTEQKHALAKALDHVMYTERWSAPVEISNGVTVRVKAVADNETRLEDTDCFGTLHWPERDSRVRPASCDGAARKLQTRSGYVWWQPPKDVLADAKVLAAVKKRVRGYFLEHWSYIGVVVQVKFPACTCCGERKHKEASLWGIESDAGAYFADVIDDLLRDARAQVTP
jgi:hypothetical protein